MNTQNKQTNICAMILAGGKASRMGYKNKGLQKLNARPLIEHIIKRLEPQVNELIISANQDIEAYSHYVETILPDKEQTYPGPMAGICSGLAHINKTQSNSDYLLVVPCDGPFLPLDLASRLYFSLQKSNQQLACVHDGQYKQPTYLLAHKNLLASAEQFLAQDKHKLGQWLKENQADLVDFSDQAQAFTNINSLQQLQEICASFP